MSLRVTLPILAALATAGAGGGMWLGHSAIAEIDPAYYSQPQARFHADKAPNRSRDWSDPQELELTDASTVEGLGDGCLTCGAEPIELFRAPEPTVYEGGWGRTAYAEAEPAVFVEEERDPELERVALYASYPVTRREAEAMAAAAEAQAAGELAEADGADLPGL